MKSKLLCAARAEMIPEATSGRWTVRKFRLSEHLPVERPGGTLPKKYVVIPPGTYTQLWCMTEATMHTYGELVMHDVFDELKTHLNFMLQARGRVLITGLGLGCVARGCLANPAVNYVTIIERDPHVLNLVARYMPTERCTIIQADALRWAADSKQTFDCAWHDLWSDPDKGEGHLQASHSHLIAALVERVALQGAWQLPRWFGRNLPSVI